MKSLPCNGQKAATVIRTSSAARMNRELDMNIHPPLQVQRLPSVSPSQGIYPGGKSNMAEVLTGVHLNSSQSKDGVWLPRAWNRSKHPCRSNREFRFSFSPFKFSGQEEARNLF